MLSQVSGLLYKSTVCVAHLETWTPDSSKEAWLFFFFEREYFYKGYVAQGEYAGATGGLWLSLNFIRQRAWAGGRKPIEAEH